MALRDCYSISRSLNASPTLPSLRKHIYTLAFGRCLILIDSPEVTCALNGAVLPIRSIVGQGSTDWDQSRNSTAIPVDLRSLRVCRQMYGEVTLLPYRLNSFNST